MIARDLHTSHCMKGGATEYGTCNERQKGKVDNSQSTFYNVI